MEQHVEWCWLGREGVRKGSGEERDGDKETGGGEVLGGG